MKPHKWAKEIKAWADGAEIEFAFSVMQDPPNWNRRTIQDWDDSRFIFRIKPQPKEPQYLYVYRGMAGDVSLSRTKYDSCIGKIKLENEDAI